MKIKKYISLILAALVVAPAFTGCGSDGCFDNQSSIPLAAFYSSETGQAIALTDLQISGVGAPNDSTLIKAGQTVKQVYLPMRSQHTSTAWCFHYAQTGIDAPEWNDTIVFDYESQPYFASEECGAMYNYRITRYSYTNHLIDSLVVADSLITNTDIARIKIYFRTATDDTGSEEEPEV